MARKSKYTPELVKDIYDVIRTGGTDYDACIFAGIDQATFYRWLHEKSEFNEQVTRARVEGKIQRIARIKKHGEHDWRADAWYLERRWPDEYAQHLIIKVSPEHNEVLKKHGLTAGEAWELLMQDLIDADND